MREFIKSKYNSRKLTVMIILSLLATLFLFLDMANFDQWSEFQKWIFGIYAGGNIGEHAANAYKERKNNDKDVK